MWFLVSSNQLQCSGPPAFPHTQTQTGKGRGWRRWHLPETSTQLGLGVHGDRISRQPCAGHHLRPGAPCGIFLMPLEPLAAIGASKVVDALLRVTRRPLVSGGQLSRHSLRAKSIARNVDQRLGLIFYQASGDRRRSHHRRGEPSAGRRRKV